MKHQISLSSQNTSRTKGEPAYQALESPYDFKLFGNLEGHLKKT